MKLTPFRKLCLIILGAVFALLIMLSSLAGLLLLFNLLNYLCVDVQTSIKDVVCNYRALLFTFWLISHFALVLLVDDDLALSNLRKLIVQHLQHHGNVYNTFIHFIFRERYLQRRNRQIPWKCYLVLGSFPAVKCICLCMGFNKITP